MAYDERLAERVRGVLAGRPRLSERKMFGGLAFLLGGNMACGVVKNELMLRVGAERYAETLALAHVRPMDFTGKPMKGMVYVGVAGLRTDAELRGWVERAIAYAASLPPKPPK